MTATRLFVLHGGGEKSMKALFDPWASDCADELYLPYYFYAIDHPDGWVLVDCGAHPDLARDPRARLGEQAEFSDPMVGDRDDVVSQIGLLGIGPADIAHVVLSHLHYDHCGGLELLPGATVHVQEAELEFARNPPVYQRPAYVADDWASVRRWVVHDGEADVYGDGSIVLVPTPGHTPGHQSVVVALPQRRVILAADAIYHPQKTAERRLPGYLWNPDALVASWERLEHLGAELDAEFLYSHHPAPQSLPLAPCAYEPGVSSVHVPPQSPKEATR